MAPPAPPAISCEITPPTLKLPDWAAARTDGRANVAIWPSTPPPTKPEMMFPTVPRSNVGDDLPIAAPPRAPAMRLISICTILISHDLPTPHMRKQKVATLTLIKDTGTIALWLRSGSAGDRSSSQSRQGVYLSQALSYADAGALARRYLS